MHHWFMLHPVYTFVKRISVEIRLFLWNYFAPSSFDLDETFVDDINVDRTHINALHVIFGIWLFSLTKCWVSFLKGLNFGENWLSVRSEKRWFDGRKEKFYFSERRKNGFWHIIKLISNQINFTSTYQLSFYLT